MQAPSSTPDYERPKVNLSCRQCQIRKRKCDKSTPCQSCTQAGLECTAVLRPRLPRGRRTNEGNRDLRQRVEKLERLLANGAATAGTGTSDWDSIGQQVFGIREMLDELAGGEDDISSSSTPDNQRDQNFDILLYGDAACFVAPDVLELPTNASISAFLEIYFERVDRIFKVIHEPSLRLIMSDLDIATPPQEALKFAVLFAAVGSLSEQECVQRFQASKKAMGSRFRLATETLLSKVELFKTNDLTTLQAFVIYLAGRQAFDGIRAVSALVASAVRIGQYLGLDTETRKRTLFETEMRRRTWFSIGILDLQSAFDNCSYSTLASSALFRHPPLHIDDSDISPHESGPVSSKDCFTGMTFCSMTHEALQYLRKMIHVPIDVDGQPMVKQSWAQRHAIADDFARILNERYYKHCDNGDVFQRLTKTVGEAMLVSMRLLVFRPMHRMHNAGPPPKGYFNVLDVATDNLYQSLWILGDNQYKCWEWFPWSRWYALAVLLAELCEHTEGPRVDAAWDVAEASFAKYKEMMQDHMLWGSIEKLMGKARSVRASSTVEAAFSTTSIDDVNIALPWDQLEMPDFQVNDPILRIDESGNASSSGHMEESQMMAWMNWESFIDDLGPPL